MYRFAKQQIRKISSQYRVVMLRHGESEWNQKNLFCGWYDAPLSDKGRQEAKSAGKTLQDGKYQFDIAFTSVLTRAINTLEIVLKELGQDNLPIVKNWRLNERHYGNLTGLNKMETAQKYGEEQVQIWRRSYDAPPPPIEPTNPYYNTILKDPRYAKEPAPNDFPRFESLKLTIQRTLPFWNKTIVPRIKAGEKVLIVAHGNSLRGIIKHLDKMTNDEIMKLNLPTGIPFVYILNANMSPKGRFKFLGDSETVKKAMEAVAVQGKPK